MPSSQSTSQGKRRRGRPSPIAQWEIDRVLKNWPELMLNRRAVYEKAYMLRTFQELRTDPLYAWLFATHGPSKELKTALLAELGRIADEEFFLSMADVVCLIKPGVRVGRGYIRSYMRHRAGRISEGREPLTPEVYFSDHPAVKAHLQIVRWIVS